MSNICFPLSLAPLCVLVAACSTAGDGGTGAGATSGPVLPVPTGDYGDDDGADGTATDGEPPLGPEDFDYCQPGPESFTPFMGWQIACSATSANRQFVNPLDDSYIEIEDVSGHFGNICCGGLAAGGEADADCQQLCMEQICEAARIQHVAWAVDVSNDGMGGDCLDVTESCGFDFALCMDGELHEQVGNPGALFSYILKAECEAAHDNVTSPYGRYSERLGLDAGPQRSRRRPRRLCAATRAWTGAPRAGARKRGRRGARDQRYPTVVPRRRAAEQRAVARCRGRSRIRCKSMCFG
jgi:hypothetical protein